MSRLKFIGSSVPEVTEAAAFGKVAVLHGGRSSEREISLKTGAAVHAALVERGVDATPIDPAHVSVSQLADGHFDRAFIALHGPGGEDGAMQGVLEWLGIPYTGSGVLGSALCMDKLRTKVLAAASGVATPDWVVLDSAEAVDSALERLGLPLIVKPVSQGSSVGMCRVEAAGDLVGAWRTAAALDPVVIAERCIIGGEYTVGVLKGEALPVIRIETPRTFYDYQAKYFANDTRYHLPCGLDAAAEAEVQRLALVAFAAAGAAGWGRVDFMIGADGVPMLLEVNTVPGMTDHSLVPMAAKAAGIDFATLVWRVLETSFMREPSR
jgi:D-alanine-D-alanine ligase